MTEQEYCDLSDLQMARAIKNLLRMMNCFDYPNKNLLQKAMSAISQIEVNTLKQIDVD
jgi:hypothetical protein